MKLEVGKYYRTRDGRKACYEAPSHVDCHSFVVFNDEIMVTLFRDSDLIAEWHDEVEDDGFITCHDSTRAHILDTAKEYVTKDRQATHGKPEGTFGLIASYWSAHLGQEITATDVASMMVLLKLARAKANPGNADNWIDAAGYAACAGELAQ